MLIYPNRMISYLIKLLFWHQPFKSWSVPRSDHHPNRNPRIQPSRNSISMSYLITKYNRFQPPRRKSKRIRKMLIIYPTLPTCPYKKISLVSSLSTRSHWKVWKWFHNPNSKSVLLSSLPSVIGVSVASFWLLICSGIRRGILILEKFLSCHPNRIILRLLKPTQNLANMLFAQL